MEDCMIHNAPPPLDDYTFSRPAIRKNKPRVPQNPDSSTNGHSRDSVLSRPVVLLSLEASH
jgi:hypothetical protein